jgi:hypothetical protein
MAKYANVKFFDENSHELNLSYDSTNDLWEGTVHLPVVSSELYETLTIYLLEEVQGMLGNVDYITPITEAASSTQIRAEFAIGEYDESEDIFLYSTTSEDLTDTITNRVYKEFYVKKETEQYQTMLPSATSTSTTSSGVKIITTNIKTEALVINATLNSKEEGYHIRTLNIYEYNPTTKLDTHHIAQIKVYGEVEGEDERLTALLHNLGMSLTPQDHLIFEDANIKELGVDWLLINRKRRELLLEASQIKPFIGTYKAILNAIKFYGYENITLKEYWLNINEQSERFGKLKAVAVPNSKIQGFLAKKGRQIEIPNSNLKKTSRFSLVFRLNNFDGTYDKWDIPNVKEALEFSPDEVLIKLYGLKRKLQKNYLPLQSKIVDITGEGDYFSQFSTNVWNNQHIIQDQNAGVKATYDIIPNDKDIYIEDLRKVDYRLTGMNQDFESLTGLTNLGSSVLWTSGTMVSLNDEIYWKDNKYRVTAADSNGLYVANSIVTNTTNPPLLDDYHPFDNWIEIYGMKLLGLGNIGGVSAVSNGFLEKVAVCVKEILNPNGTGILIDKQKAAIQNMKDLSVAQLIGHTSMGSYNPPLNVQHYPTWDLVRDKNKNVDFIWETPAALGRDQTLEVLEHLLHTITTFALPGAYPFRFRQDIQAGDLWEAMQEAIANSVFDTSNYGAAPAYGTTAYNEYQGLLMREYIYLLILAEWDLITVYTTTPGFLSPEWNVNSNDPTGVAANNPKGHTLYTEYISKIISKPDTVLLDSMFSANLPFNVTAGVATYVTSLGFLDHVADHPPTHESGSAISGTVTLTWIDYVDTSKSIQYNIENYYENLYGADMSSYNDTDAGPIGAPIVLKVNSFTKTWAESTFTWDDAGDSNAAAGQIEWDNWWYRNVYEIQWRLVGTSKSNIGYDRKFRGPAEEFYQMALTLPHPGKYTIELTFFDLYNVASINFTKDAIEVKQKEVEIYGLYSKYEKPHDWNNWLTSWKSGGGTWDISHENLDIVNDCVGTYYLTMDRANYPHDESSGWEFSTVRRYVDSNSVSGFSETPGPYAWKNLIKHGWEDGTEMSWDLTRVGSDVNSSFKIKLVGLLGGGSLKMTYVNHFYAYAYFDTGTWASTTPTAGGLQRFTLTFTSNQNGLLGLALKQGDYIKDDNGNWVEMVSILNTTSWNGVNDIFTITLDTGTDGTSWAAGAYAAGSYVNDGTHVYYTTAGGNSAAAGPTHSTGTVADGGGVSWLCTGLVTGVTFTNKPKYYYTPETKLTDSVTINQVYPATNTGQTDLDRWQAIADFLNTLDPETNPLITRYTYNPVYEEAGVVNVYADDICNYILAVSKEPSKSYDWTTIYFDSIANGDLDAKLNFTSYNPKYTNSHTFRSHRKAKLLTHITFSFDNTRMPGIISHDWKLVNNSKNISDIYYSNKWLTYVFQEKGNYSLNLTLKDINGNTNTTTKNIITIT